MEAARAKPSLPPNYVTLKQLQELRLREKQQRDEEEERLRGLKEAQEEEKLRRLNEEEEEKRRKDEERLRPPPGAPNPGKPRRRSGSGSGPRPRNANPEVRAAKDADWKPIKAAAEGSNPERDDRVREARRGPEGESVDPEARGGVNVNVGGDPIERGNSKKKIWKGGKKKRENRTGPEGANRPGLQGKGEYRTVRYEPDRTAETSLHIGNVTEKSVETLHPEPDDGPENNIPIGGDLIERGDSKKKTWKSREEKGKNRTGPEGANRPGLRVKGEYRTVTSEPDRTAETSAQIGKLTEKLVETLHPEPSDGPENTIPNRNRGRGKRVNRMGRFGEPRASGGDETTGAEMGRRTAGRWGGWFGRGWRSGVGPREGLVWIKKESVP